MSSSVGTFRLVDKVKAAETVETGTSQVFILEVSSFLSGFLEVSSLSSFLSVSLGVFFFLIKSSKSECCQSSFHLLFWNSENNIIALFTQILKVQLEFIIV